MSLKLEAEFVEYKDILSHVGKIGGFVCECDLGEIMSRFDEKLIFSLKNAKGVMVHFEMSEDVKLVTISDFMANINQLVKKDTDVIFETTTNNSLIGQNVKFRIILTGIC